MWERRRIERDEMRLLEAEEMIQMWCSYVLDKEFSHPAGWELQNMLLVSGLIVSAARKRRESRGVHHRTDYPQTDNTRWKNISYQAIKHTSARIKIIRQVNG